MSAVDYETRALPAQHGVEILRTEVGSTLHGTGLAGHEDHDEMGVFVEHQRTTIGLGNVEHYDWRSAPQGERSTPADTDLIVYSLRKWARLALSGNPSVLLLLFAPEDKIVINTDLGRELRRERRAFASLRAGKAFLGYMEQQRQRMVGQRGRAGRVRVMPDGGVDWKYAMHMLRLGYQGVEYLATGTLTLPIEPERGDYLRSVRSGAVPFEEVITAAEALEERVKALLNGDSPLPADPDFERVERFVIDAHLAVWSSSDTPSPDTGETRARASE